MNQQQTQLNVLLLGDICVDQYVFGNVTRLSPEAPIPVLDFNNTEQTFGMAGNVYNNLTNLDCNVTMYAGDSGIKVRYIDKKTNQQLLRLDYPPENKVQYEPVDLDGYDVIVISDYDKGYLSYDDIEGIVQKSKCPVFIDTKKTDIKRFEGAFIKINDIERSRLASTCTELIVTYGGEKVTYKGMDYKVPKVEAFDVCGAGDTFLAGLAIGYTLSKDMTRAITFAMAASAITVRHLGVYAPTLEEIHNEITR